MKPLSPTPRGRRGRLKAMRTRRRVCALVTVVAVALIVGSSSVARSQSGENWPSLQGGPDHAGEAPEAARPPLKQVWRTGPRPDASLSSVAVIPGLAVATGRTLVVGLDPSSGRILWTAGRAGGPLGTPAIDPTAGSNGVIVFTEGNTRTNSAVGALDLSTQQRLWTTPVSDLVVGSPAIESGAVFVGARDRTVYGLEAATGKLLWKRITSGGVLGTPAVAGGRVLVTSLDEATGSGRVSALDVSTGVSRWSFASSRPAQGISSATVSEDRVFVGFNDEMVRAFALSTGQLLWSEPVRASFSPVSTLAASGGSVYAADNLGGIYRFEAATGRRQWDFQFGADVTWGSPLVAGDVVYVGMDDGALGAIDVVSGHVIWRGRHRFGPTGAAAPAGDFLLISALGQQGGIIAYEHDPRGSLIDEVSPTELHFPVALANFAGAALVMTALILGMFRWLARRRGDAEPSYALGGDDGEQGETPT